MLPSLFCGRPFRVGIIGRIGAYLCASALALVMANANGQDQGMPADLAAKVAAIGRVIDPPKPAVLYAPLAPIGGSNSRMAHERF